MYVQIWDTAGTERYKSFSPMYYRDTDCCLLVCDLTAANTLQSLDTWLDEFFEYVNPRDPEHISFVVIGNKVDEVESRQVCQPRDVHKSCFCILVLFVFTFYCCNAMQKQEQLSFSLHKVSTSLVFITQSSFSVH